MNKNKEKIKIDIKLSRRKKNKKHIKNGSSTSAIALYLASMSNPFNVAAPKVAAGGNIGASGSFSLYNRVIGVPVGASDTAFAILFNPNYTTGSAGVFGSSNEPYATSITGLTTAVLNATANTTTYYSPANVSAFNAVAETFRPVTGGLRVTVRYPMTTTPGRLFVMLATTSSFWLSTKGFPNLASEGNAFEVPFVSGGSVEAECKYKWGSPQDMTFLLNGAATPISNASINTRCMVIGLGWPAGSYAVDFSTIAHCDYHGGSLNAASDYEDDNPTLDLPIESIASKTKEIPPYAHQLSILKEDGAFRRVTRLHGMSHSVTSSSAFKAAEAVNDSAPYTDVGADYDPRLAAMSTIGVAAGTAVLGRIVGNAVDRLGAGVAAVDMGNNRFR